MKVGAERRRSARHLLTDPAEVQLGTQSLVAEVTDVSAHGMGLSLPRESKMQIGATIWIQVGSVASYAITGIVRRAGSDGRIGVEFSEVLAGSSLEVVEGLPTSDL